MAAFSNSVPSVLPGEPDAPPEEIVPQLEERDVVAVNRDSRTYRVTDVVDQVGSDGDDYDTRRVIRLTGYKERGRLALVYEEGESTSVEVRVLDDDRVPGTGGTYEVTHLNRFPTDPEWVIHFRTGTKYHRPDPVAALKGEAKPLCGANDSDFPTFKRRNVVSESSEACSYCFRHMTKIELPDLICPECGRELGRGVLTGMLSEAVESINMACPTCEFSGEIDV